MNLETAPAIPEEVVTYLEETFSTDALHPNMPVNEMYAHLGRIGVVRHLRRLCDKQNPLKQ